MPSAPPSQADVLLASNRGPLAFRLGDDGVLHLSRGGGGLVSGVAAATAAGSAVWVCAALSDADRMAASGAPDGRLDRAGHDTGGTAVRMLAIEEATFRRAYNAVANSTLWYVNHTLFDTPHSPIFDARWSSYWRAYVDYNQAFADALAEEAADGAKVLVQDYHLMLVPALLRQRRPDLRIGHFTHTPWAVPSYFSLLPDDVTVALLTGLLGADAVGFHSPRWAAAFSDCCVELLGAQAGAGTVTLGGRTTRVQVNPLGVDADSLRERAAQTDVRARREAMQRRIGDRRAIVRVDRTELSKNIVRGLHAYRELLRSRPEHRGHVVHVVLAYPSRHDLPDYRAYTAEVQRVAREIDDEFATAGWSPVLLEVNDDYSRSLAALQLADVLVVNPLRDGMNLVAKEGPVLAGDVAVVLSREAGAADELGAEALLINPYDVSGTAEAIHAALTMPAEQRRLRAERLAAAAVGSPPRAWLQNQLDAL
ncbi:MAG TPA: trehalose-6-phosphate synthase [Mycobacteriales bacterium]|nr:trehalose-6-phosphate synthase [Mycobacteriales bacterium]